ncbi:MAG: lysylphosphatidylglycerol synthase transmembrane domain-containing protein [Chloroflexota bacterium]
MSIVVPIVVVVLVLAALPGFHLDQLATYLSEANPWWLLAAVAIYYAGFPLRGYRWALLVRGAGYPLKVRDSTEIILISWLVNCLVPAKLGDVYRAYLLRINTGISLSTTFGTVFIERMFDLIAIATLGLAAGFWSFREGMSPEVRIIFGFGLVVLVVLVVGLVLVRNFGRRLMTRLPFPKRVVEMYDLFEEGMFGIDRRTVLIVAALTGLIWTTEALRLLFVIEAMPFHVRISISGAVLHRAHRVAAHGGPVHARWPGSGRWRDDLRAHGGVPRPRPGGRHHPGRPRHQRAVGHRGGRHRLRVLVQDAGNPEITSGGRAVGRVRADACTRRGGRARLIEERTWPLGWGRSFAVAFVGGGLPGATRWVSCA